MSFTSLASRLAFGILLMIMAFAAVPVSTDPSPTLDIVVADIG